MNYCEIANKHIQDEALFVSRRQCLWDIRQDTRQALLDGQKASRFVITHEELYCADMVEQVLCDPDAYKNICKEFMSSMTGTVEGCLRCVLLVEQASRGILLHNDGKNVHLAFYPPVTYQQAEAEHLISMRLSEIAYQAKDIPIQLDRVLSQGEHRLSDVLDYLSEQIDI